ncbi:MAG: purine-nucleoside phosphorylase [Trueperaceae bacterium]|nr:purine-nucleoside phosphorylase [Trueperaceae bacterium]
MKGESYPTVEAFELAASAIRAKSSVVPEVALILGSGLGPLADEIEGTRIPYADVPGMHVSSAPGHAGRFVLGSLAGRPVIAMQGRLHPYEGISAADCAFPVGVMHALGARTLIATNACGGLNPSFNAGELMLILDMINNTGQNPLTGPNQPGLERFPVMYDCFDPAYLEVARSAARRLDIRLNEGVYIAIAGPAYSTRAEIRAFTAWGADAVGMSTVFEVMKARHLGMRVLGISVVTDMALADSHEHTTGDEVVKMANRAGATLGSLLKAVVSEL